MPLAMRKNSLASQDWADLTIYDDGRPIGRIYEDPMTLRWYWFITMWPRQPGVRIDGRCATFEEAEAEFQEHWRKWLVAAKLAPQ
jgi:hypothetical protein